MAMLVITSWYQKPNPSLNRSLEATATRIHDDRDSIDLSVGYCKSTLKNWEGEH